MKAIIVDDEAQSHIVLKQLLTDNHQDIEVIASAYSVAEGVEQILRLKPDIIFLDIELPDGLGFDILEKITKPDFQVVFISAHQHYAIQAIDFGAFAYLLKPIFAERLKSVLDRLIIRIEKETMLKQIELVQEIFDDFKLQKLPRRMGIALQDGIVFFPVEDIVYLKASESYTSFVLAKDKQKILASNNIGQYVRYFDPYPNFKQVHRSYMVNRNFVVKYIRTENYLVMNNGDHIKVSRTYRDSIEGWLKSM